MLLCEQIVVSGRAISMRIALISSLMRNYYVRLVVKGTTIRQNDRFIQPYQELEAIDICYKVYRL